MSDDDGGDITLDQLVQKDEFQEELERIEGEIPDDSGVDFDPDEFMQNVESTAEEHSKRQVEQFLHHVAEGGCDDEDKECHRLAREFGMIEETSDGSEEEENPDGESDDGADSSGEDTDPPDDPGDGETPDNSGGSSFPPDSWS